MKLFIILILFVGTSIQTCPDEGVELTPWSTWSKKPASADQDLIIEYSESILLDVSPPRINTLTINGKLVVSPKGTFHFFVLNSSIYIVNLTLDVYNIYVYGTFIAGTKDCPILSSLTITLWGEYNPGVSPVQNVGTKVIAGLYGSSIDIHGSPHDKVWTFLGATATASSSSITLSEEVDWKVGDTIVITSTDFEPFDSIYNGEEDLVSQNEVRKITGRPSSTVIQLDSPLKYPHWGQTWKVLEICQTGVR